tara:strand:+ start:18360 stop:19394 length:1035 start_codon:yes stop_codon:yes gene_type:complete
MIKSYEQYIKEHFGAITIEYPPEDLFTRNPSVPTPLALNTHVGGAGRMPMHWNNSPYLSGGFGGSGYGRFGSDPDAGNNNNDIGTLYTEMDQYVSSLLDKVKAELDLHVITKTENGEYEKILDEIKKNISSKKLILDEDYLDPEEGTINYWMMDSEIIFEVEMETPPTSGVPGTYYDPPEPGESGEYETTVWSSVSDETPIDPTPGIGSMEDVISTFNKYKRFIQITMYNEGLNKVYDMMQSTINNIGGWIDSEYEELDHEYFDVGGTSSKEEAGEVVDNLGILYYIFRIVTVPLGSIQKDRAEMQKVAYRRPPKNQYKLSDKCLLLLSNVINIPDILKSQPRE